MNKFLITVILFCIGNLSICAQVANERAAQIITNHNISKYLEDIDTSTDNGKIERINGEKIIKIESGSEEYGNKLTELKYPSIKKYVYDKLLEQSDVDNQIEWYNSTFGSVSKYGKIPESVLKKVQNSETAIEGAIEQQPTSSNQADNLNEKIINNPPTDSWSWQLILSLFLAGLSLLISLIALMKAVMNQPDSKSEEQKITPTSNYQMLQEEINDLRRDLLSHKKVESIKTQESLSNSRTPSVATSPKNTRFIGGEHKSSEQRQNNQTLSKKYFSKAINGFFNQLQDNQQVNVTWFEVKLQNGNNSAEFKIIDSVLQDVMNSMLKDNSVFSSACEAENFKENAKSKNPQLKLETPGRVIKEGNRWKIDRYAKYKFV